MALCLMWLVYKMIQARQEKIVDKCHEIVVSTASDQSTMESIVAAQHGLQTIHDIMQMVNITILKIKSIFVSRAPKVKTLPTQIKQNSISNFSRCFKKKFFCIFQHSNTVMSAMVAAAAVLAMIPFKYIIIVSVLWCFAMTSKLGDYIGNDPGNRRLREWWDSIPVIPVKVIDKPLEHK